VAIKILRNNELMRKAGLSEAKYLKRLMEDDPHDKYFVIRMIDQFIHLNHVW
jgi:serine/threonine-protein kinase PRP4